MAEIYHQYQGFYEPNKATNQKAYGLKLHKLHMVVIVLYLVELLIYSKTELTPAQKIQYNHCYQ